MKKLTKRFLIPLVIACMLVLGGAIGSFALASSGLAFESEDYTAWFYLNHLQIHLLENGNDVCGGENTLDGENKVSGDLVQYLGYSDGKLGTIEPGKRYEEVIAAQNKLDIPVYVRMTIRKYWCEANEDGTAGDKVADLSPDKIHLQYGNEEYNTGSWFKNDSESTAEQTTYYYKNQLGTGEKGITDPLFDNLVIDNTLMKREESSRETDPETGVTTITYEYTYDGYAFMIKADVQAIQTHNATDAIHSQWGVYDVAEGSDHKSLRKD